MLVHLILSQKSLRLSVLFILFFFILLLSNDSYHYTFQLTTASIIASINLLLIPSRVFLISVIVLFITVYLFFISFSSLWNVLNDSWPFLHSILKILDHLWKAKVKVSYLCPTLFDPMDCTVYGVSPDQNTRLGGLSLLQGIFPTQGSNPGLPHCRWIFYLLSHQETQGYRNG